MNTEELWKLHVHNATFDVQMSLQNLHLTLMAMAGADQMIRDDFCLFERQIALMRSEAKRLVSLVGRLRAPQVKQGRHEDGHRG